MWIPTDIVNARWRRSNTNTAHIVFDFWGHRDADVWNGYFANPSLG